MTSQFMIYRFRTVKIVFLLLYAAVLSSCTLPQHPIPAPHTAVQMDPGIVYGRLPNGFQYILKKNKTPEHRAFVHLNVFSGSVQETRDQQGVAHYLEHMLFNGSEHFKPGELVDYFHSIGMDFGADANAHTGFFETVYDLALPKADRNYLDKAFLIIQDYAGGALLLESEIERERGIILAEKRERDSISYRTFKKSLAFELEGSLLKDRLPIGTEDVISKADRTLLKAYYDKWYRPDNMALVVVGDIDVQTVRQMIVDRFSRLKSAAGEKSVDHGSVKWLPHKGDKAFYYHEPEASTTDITIQTLTYTPFEPQTVSMLKKQVIRQMANSILQNRISRQINQQKADFTEASVYSGSYLHFIQAAVISATCRPELWEKTLEQIERNLRQALEYGFTRKELSRIKTEFIAGLEQAVSLSGSQKSDHLARRLLSKINNRQLLLSEKQRLAILKPYIESITPSQFHEAFKDVWDKDHRLIMVTGNARIDSSQPEKRILTVFQNSQKKAVVPYQAVQSRPFPYLDEPTRKGRIKSSKTPAADLGIQTIVFENNVRLNLKQTDFKPNEFVFKVCFGRGKQSEPRKKPGLALAADAVLKESGLGRIDKDQLEEALAGRKISTHIGIKDNYIAISGSGPPEEALVIFQLIRHYLKDPGLRKKALDLFKTRYKQDYDARVRTPDGLMDIKGLRFLAENDSRFGMPSPETVNNYTIKDVEEWILPAFEHAPIEISIAGDFNSGKMIDLAASYIGTIKGHQAFPKTLTDAGKIAFPKGKDLYLEIDTKIDTAVVHVAFLTDDFWDIMQTRRLSILSRVFSERLRKIIREELGESYSPYVYNNGSTIFKDYGVLHVVVNVKPGNQGIVVDKINEIVNSIRAGGISKQETEYALKPVLTHLKSLRKTNAYWLNSVMADSSNYPAKFDWARNILTGYGSISSADLNALAKKYLVMKERALIIITPVLERN